MGRVAGNQEREPCESTASGDTRTCGGADGRPCYNGAETILELLLETGHCGILHTRWATVLDRLDLAHRVARRFGLSGGIVQVRTADVKLPGPRPLRCGLKVDRAAALLRAKPLDIEAQLERFKVEWFDCASAGRLTPL